MPLVREQRDRLARALRWSRMFGWKHDVHPHSWRSADGLTHVRYDAQEQELVVDRFQPGQDPLKYRVALVPVDSPDRALRVLAALGDLPIRLGFSELDDDEIRAAYRTLMLDGRHAYMSLSCQHGQHDDCQRTCACCGATCVCTSCLHVDRAPAPAKCLMWYENDEHGQHTWERNDEWVECSGWPPPRVEPVDPDSFDGPTSFIDAGQVFADLVDGRVLPDQAADALSKLARQGLIISVEYHDETCGGQADGLAIAWSEQ